MKLKLLHALFGGRPATEAAPPLSPEQRARQVERDAAEAEKQASARARQRREEEEAEQLAERARASQEEIERSCRTLGFWWPGESTPVGRFGQDRGGFVERLVRMLKGE